MKNVAVIGLGNMGMGMAHNLVRKGFSVSGFARTLETRQALDRIGGQSRESSAQAAKGCDAVFLMVLDGEQVLDILRGGLKDALSPGATLIVTATIGRSAMLHVQALLQGSGVHLLDSPVSGGRGGAEAGSLTLMVAGAASVLEGNRDVLEAIGKNIYHVGEQVGHGQVLKACLQALIGVTYEGLFEAMVLGAKAGLDPQVLSTVINNSFVGSRLTETTTAQVVQRQFQGGGSHIGTMHKDFGISMDMARELGVPMPAASVAMQMFQAGKTAIPDGDNWCIVQLLEQLAATRIRKAP